MPLECTIVSGAGGRTPRDTTTRRQPELDYPCRELGAHRGVRARLPVAIHARATRGPGRGLRPGGHPGGSPRGCAPASRGGDGAADGDRVHIDVPPRRMDAPHRQHALSVDLRRQRRRQHGPRALHRLLPSVRGGGGARAGSAGHALAGADDRCKRSDFGGARSLSAALPPRPRAGADPARLLHPAHPPAGQHRPGALVRAPALQFAGDAVGRWRRRLRRTHRWLRRGNRADSPCSSGAASGC